MTDHHGGHPVDAGRASRLAIASLIVAASIVRVGVLLAVPDTFADDPDAYRAVGINIAEHGCFGSGDRPFATRPLLYPLVVAACYAIDPGLWYSLAVVHVVLGVATVVLTYRIALHWGLEQRWALVAAALVAIDPVLLLHSTQVMTETLATFLAVAGLLAATRCAERPTAFRAALCGAILAAAGLCRPTFLVWMAPVAVLLPVFTTRWRDRALVFAATFVAACLVLSPWMIRNQIQFCRPTPATNHGGFTLLLANNPSFYRYLRTASPGDVWDADAFNREWAIRRDRLVPGNEVAADRLAYRDAFAVISDQPGTFAYACLVRWGRIWGLVPRRTSDAEGLAGRTARWAVGAFYAVEFLLALGGLISLFRGVPDRERLLKGWIWGLLLVAGFTAMHTFYWTNIRMRAPLTPVVCAAAALGAARLGGRRSACKVL